MRQDMLAKAKLRLENARRSFLEMQSLGPDFEGFESIWYSFLMNHSGFFTVLEQAAKSNPNSKAWFKGVKQFRLEDPILLYVYQARNFDEHNGVSSVFRHGFLFKPKTKNAIVRYRGADGKRLSSPKITVTKSADGSDAQLEIIPPGIRFRTVWNKWGVFEFPKTYSHPILEELLRSGAISGDSAHAGVPHFIVIALAHADRIYAEAEALAIN